MTYADKFRLKDKSVDIDIKVNDLFKRLAPTHVLGCRMSNLSGGERRRVMIAVELITDPKIIFLDEPTSGLDNNTAVKIVRLLKELSKEGRTILFTIHQPDDITANEFDEILLLSQGRSVYIGKMTNCEKHLTSCGFVKKPIESISNFAMKGLSVEPGVYHETAESSKLNALVTEVKKQPNFCEEEKRVKKSNDLYFNLIPNFYHTMLLLKRRLKLQLFSRKNILTFLWGFILTGIVILMFRRAEKFAGSNILIDISFEKGSTDQGTDYRDNLALLMPVIRQASSMVLGVFLIALLPLTTSMAFVHEQKHVKREMAVNTYSMVSYWFSFFYLNF